MTADRPPRVIFLDEPTTGLDPRSRRQMWDDIRDLVADGVTIMLTTQYLDEADELADRVAASTTGGSIAEGAPDELKRRVPGGHIRAQFADIALGRRCTPLRRRDPRSTTGLTRPPGAPAMASGPLAASRRSTQLDPGPGSKVDRLSHPPARPRLCLPRPDRRPQRADRQPRSHKGIRRMSTLAASAVGDSNVDAAPEPAAPDSATPR